MDYRYVTDVVQTSRATPRLSSFQREIPKNNPNDTLTSEKNGKYGIRPLELVGTLDERTKIDQNS